MKTDISGKNALITGASKGIGKAIAISLAAEGVNVFLVARDKQSLAKTATEIRNLSSVKVFEFSGDIADATQIPVIYSAAKESLGQVDILVNNGGGPKAGAIMSLDESDWQNAINLNLMSVVRLTTLATADMRKTKWGRVVTITSTVAKEPSPTMILSATARAGVTAFSKSLSTELAPLGITINTVCPGGVLTDRLNQLLSARAQQENLPLDKVMAENLKVVPAGRYAQPDEIADYVTFLCSERGAYITGTSISVDGGICRSVF